MTQIKMINTDVFKIYKKSVINFLLFFGVLIIFCLPVLSESEIIADYRIITNKTINDVKVSQLIYYLEKFEVNYTSDKSSAKWITNKIYSNNNKIIITDDLTGKGIDGKPFVMLGYTMEFKKNLEFENTIILEKIITRDLDGSIETKGKEIDDLINTAQRNNFELPNNKQEKVLESPASLQPIINPVETKQEDNSESNFSKFLKYLKIGAFIIIILVILYLVAGFSTSCPKCKKWFMADLQSKKEISRKNSHKTVTEKTTHRDRNGRVTGTSEKKKQVPITLVNYELDYKCKECNHSWLKYSEKEI